MLTDKERIDVSDLPQNILVPQPTCERAGGLHLPENGISMEEVEKKLKEPQPEKTEPKLEGEQGKIWEALHTEPLHVDNIGRMVGLSPPQLAPLLLDMELKGLIRQLPGMRYTRTILYGNWQK